MDSILKLLYHREKHFCTISHVCANIVHFAQQWTFFLKTAVCTIAQIVPNKLVWCFVYAFEVLNGLFASFLMISLLLVLCMLDFSTGKVTRDILCKRYFVQVTECVCETCILSYIQMEARNLMVPFNSSSKCLHVSWREPKVSA